MYVDAAVVRELEARYGVPRTLEMTLVMAEPEYALCRRAASRGRAHDVTLVIPRGPDSRRGEIAGIRKWSYPPGLFRPPSGGVEPGEAFAAGAVREAWEETGLEVSLDRYLVRASARFECDGDALAWTTHVFSARWLGGEIGPRDTREIAEARWVTIAALNGEMRERMLSLESAGFRYRVALHDAALAALEEGPWPVEG